MKLSQLTTDQALDVLCECTPFISNIATDQALFDAIGKGVDTKGMTRMGILLAGAERLNKIVPLLLKTHRADVYGILSAVNRVPVEAIASQNVLKTAAQLYELLKDKEMLDFFKSCAGQGPKP